MKITELLADESILLDLKAEKKKMFGKLLLTA